MRTHPPSHCLNFLYQIFLVMNKLIYLHVILSMSDKALDRKYLFRSSVHQNKSKFWIFFCVFSHCERHIKRCDNTVYVYKTSLRITKYHINLFHTNNTPPLIKAGL